MQFLGTALWGHRRSFGSDAHCRNSSKRTTSSKVRSHSFFCETASFKCKSWFTSDGPYCLFMFLFNFFLPGSCLSTFLSCNLPLFSEYIHSYSARIFCLPASLMEKPSFGSYCKLNEPPGLGDGIFGAYPWNSVEITINNLIIKSDI